MSNTPTSELTFAVLTPDPRNASRVEERLFIPNELETSRFKLVYGGWKDFGQYKYADSLIHNADGYVIHGQFPDYLTSDVLNYVFASGKPVIYFFDESLPDITSGTSRTNTGYRKYLIESLKKAHLVVVETEAQKNFYQALNNKIFVLPPKLDATRYSHTPPESDGVTRVIYSGREGHLENLLLIRDALAKLADRHPGKLEFHFFGRGLAALGNHLTFHFNPYPASLQEWDKAIQSIRPVLALMPLRKSAGNELASTAPLLGYAAYGIAVAASNIVPYRAQIRTGHNGLLVENTRDAWLDALDKYVNNPHELLKLGQHARAWIETEHSLSDQSGNLSPIFELAIENARFARPSKVSPEFEIFNKKPVYQKFLDAHWLLPRDVRWMDEEIQRWKAPTHFHLLITLLPNHTQWLSRTLDSLDAQIYPHWKLTIVAFTPKPEELALDERAHWYEVGDDEDSYEALNRLAMEEGFGWVGFLEAGDTLARQALFKLALHALHHPQWRVMYADEDQISIDENRSNPLFKPDYNPDLLKAYSYTGNFCLFDHKLFAQEGGINGERDGAEIYDLLLRSTEQLAPSAIGHLAEILYSRFELGGHCVLAQAEILQNSQQALQDHFSRRSISVELGQGPFPGAHEIIYPLDRTPLVSILIPTRDHLELIKPCIDSLLEKTDYPNFEVLILNNDSRDTEVLDYFYEIRVHPRIHVLDYPHPFNFSAICNFGAQQAEGEYLLLLNNDTEIIQPQWLSELMRHGLRPEAGIVGARLFYPDGSLQHAGVVMGLSGLASHPFADASPSHPGYMYRAQLTQNYSAVTGACMLVRKDLFQSFGGLDDVEFKVLYNDVDFCLRVRETGKLVVWTPRSSLIHKASISINEATQRPTLSSQLAQAAGEHDTLYKRWIKWMAFDPAYNRNLTMISNQFGIETDPILTSDPEWRPAPRILAYPGDLEGCGEYRVFGPCRALSQSGLAQAFVSEALYYPFQLAKVDPDVVILQRQVEDIQLYDIGGIKRYSRAFRVFELDDLLHDLPPSSFHHNAIHGDELERIAEAIGMCDRFVTTTPVLADVYGHFCKDVKIVPNYVEKAKWEQLHPVRLQGRKPRVGWAGGASHAGDLQLLHDVIKALHKEVDWVFFGMCPEQLKPFIAEFHSPVKLDFYPSKLASLNLDLALAPLEQNLFNEAKSSLKLLEYGVLGYPVICTDIAPYQGDFPVTLVPNNPNEWIEAIRHAISDRDALARQGEALRSHVRQNWMLEDNLDKWLEAWLP